ncbi:MAG: ADP-ribosylglycohydrolase family protein [Spirochaeta sp.]|nr:ADP-ribosylglycohydrolase family protein [Spirochaeta sp.]
MSKQNGTELLQAAILGTVVADASGMGLHWIYSQGKIAQIVKAAGGTAEFFEPHADNYQGVPAFFAHPQRHAGDSSNYGEYLYVLLRAVGEQGFDRGAYVRAFGEHFGVGGTYVGYADTPMRETVFNMTRLGKDIEQRILSTKTSLDENQQKAAAHYIARYFLEFDTDGLKETVRTPLKLQEWKAEQLNEVDRIIDVVSSELGALGPDDDQMPALSRSAVLAHFAAEEKLDRLVEQAVRITNDNDEAVAYSCFFAHIMRDIYETGRPNPEAAQDTLRKLVDRHAHRLSSHAQELVSQAMAYETLDYRGATKHFGAACHVDMAVPLVLHILLNTTSFREANRINILASGDNCGRAVMLGAVAGALYGIGGEHGIPQEWIERTSIVKRLRETDGARLLLG